MRSGPRDLRVIVGQLETRAYTVRRALRSDRVRFDGLVCARPRHENAIVREDLLPAGYRVSRRRFLVAFLGPAKSGGNIVDIGR